MPDVLLPDFAAEARKVRSRTLLDIESRPERLMDATLRSQRAGSMRFAFRDSLVGFGEALRDVLLEWGVPDRAISTNDTPVAGHFIDRKFWDFVIRDSGGRTLVLIELQTMLSFWRSRSVSGFACTFHRLLGMLFDAQRARRRAFVGIVVVRLSLARAPSAHRPSRRALTSGARIHQRLQRFHATCRSSDLLDAMAYLDLTPGAECEPLNELSVERFLRTLYDKLLAIPQEAWRKPAPSLRPDRLMRA